MDPDSTLPPRPPNTIRAFLARAAAWARAHPDEVAVPVVAFVAGILLGNVI